MLKLDCSHSGYVFVEAASCLFTPESADYSQVSLKYHPTRLIEMKNSFLKNGIIEFDLKRL